MNSLVTFTVSKDKKFMKKSKGKPRNNSESDSESNHFNFKKMEIREDYNLK